MSKKRELKKAIDDVSYEIEVLEQKRERSQTAIIRAWLNGVKPSAEDSNYFLTFSMLIDNERENLRKLSAELEQLEKKR